MRTLKFLRKWTSRELNGIKICTGGVEIAVSSTMLSLNYFYIII